MRGQTQSQSYMMRKERRSNETWPMYVVNVAISELTNLGSFWQLFRLRDIFGHSTDVLNPSAEVKQAITSLLLFLIIHQRGKHNIEYQLTYAGSNFIFHDSRGIEAGSEGELKIVKEFIQKREQLVDLSDQLHVIWYSHSLLTNRYNLPYLLTGIVSQWMISVQYLGQKRHSLVLELAEVFFLSLFVQPLIMSFFSSACCAHFH
jgi:hypothetical protein